MLNARHCAAAASKGGRWWVYRVDNAVPQRYNKDLLVKVRWLLRDREISMRTSSLHSDLSPELAWLGIAYGFAGCTTNQDNCYTAKMRIPLCSAATCRQIYSGRPLRVWRPQLVSRLTLRNVRYNSSGMLLSCDELFLAWAIVLYTCIQNISDMNQRNCFLRIARRSA